MELDTAMEWGLTPWQFDGCPKEEKAEMMAFMWAKRRVESFMYEQAEKDSKKEAAKNEPPRLRR